MVIAQYSTQNLKVGFHYLGNIKALLMKSLT